MKKYFFILLSIIIFLSAAAQTPKKISYQAVIRDASHRLVKEQAVGVKIDILKGFTLETAISVYSETHNSSTNKNGLLTIEIGAGNVVSGDMNSINWGTDNYFVKVQTDPDGGSNYTIEGTSQLLSVPYALYAQDVANKDDADHDPNNEIQTLSISGQTLTISEGNSVTLPSGGGGNPAGNTGNIQFNMNSSFGASSDLFWKDSDQSLGIGTNNPKAMLHVAKNSSNRGNVVFTGELSNFPGAPPVSGAGTRMMWYPDKAAFRAGTVNGSQWDKRNIGNGSVAMGVGTTASGNWSTAIGVGTTASELRSTAMGSYTTASGHASIAMGENTTASGDWSTAMGWKTKASEKNSTAMGAETTASGHASIAMGENTIASGDWSTAMGKNTTASEIASTAMGKYTKALGYASTAMGSDTKASGDVSTAMGFNTEASGLHSVAMGKQTKASGLNSVAMGKQTKASSSNSLAMGEYTEASGKYSTAMGLETTANAYAEVAVGAYNIATSSSADSWNDSDPIFVIGNGALYNRHNAMTVLKNGNIGFGDIIAPDYTLHLPNSSNGNARAKSWTTYSDRRVKSNIKTIDYGLSEIMKMKPVSYFHHESDVKNNAINVLNSGKEDIGFVAQDIYKIIPEVVSKPKDDTTELWGMTYEKLVPVLVKAIQEQQKTINSLLKRVEELENK